MFRKLVSNLPFSPALVHDVGFYAKRLRKEEATRRLTVLFVALALVMQSLAMVSPPESANASSEQDIIRGGISSLDDLLAFYDNNQDDVKDILTTIGITRSELASLTPATINSGNNTYALTRYGQFGNSSEEASLAYQRSTGGTDVRYFSPLDKIGGKHLSLDGWVGESAQIGWFGIVKSSGSVVTRGVPASVQANNVESPSIKKSIHAVNLTQQNAPAVNNLARPLDKIAYTLTLTNSGDTSASATFSTQMSDALEYSTLIDAGGATYNDDSNTLYWQPVQLKPGEAQERTFVLQLRSQLSAAPRGQSNPSSYDCVINVAFGSDLHVPVDCPAVKGAESIISKLPTTGIVANIVFATILLVVVAYFYARTRQLKKEIRIIRHSLNTGII